MGITPEELDCVLADRHAVQCLNVFGNRIWVEFSLVRPFPDATCALTLESQIAMGIGARVAILPVDGDSLKCDDYILGFDNTFSH